MRIWWVPSIVGLLGCNAVFGLDERTRVAARATDAGKVPDSAVRQVADATESAMTDTSAPEETVPDDALDAGCSSGTLACNGQQPTSCADSTWQTLGDACSGTTPMCFEGMCVECQPGSTGCSGSEDAGPGDDADENTGEETGPHDGGADTGAHDGGGGGGPDVATTTRNCNAAESVCCSTGCVNGSGLMQCGGTGCSMLQGGVNACCSSGIDGTQTYCNASISNAPCRLRN
jgi:hypothetical protein